MYFRQLLYFILIRRKAWKQTEAYLRWNVCKYNNLNANDKRAFYGYRVAGDLCHAKSHIYKGFFTENSEKWIKNLLLYEDIQILFHFYFILLEVGYVFYVRFFFVVGKFSKWNGKSKNKIRKLISSFIFWWFFYIFIFLKEFFMEA